MLNKKLLKLTDIFTFSASGILGGCAVCFSDSIGALIWISMVPALLAFMRMLGNEKNSLGAVYAYGLLYFECYFAVCFHWFAYMYPMDFTGLDNVSSVLVIILAIFGLSLLQAVGCALVFVFPALVGRILTVDRMKKFSVLLFPLAYVSAEFLQTLGWWGVPWGRICLGASYDSALLGSASLFGSYFVSFSIVAVNVGIAAAIAFIKAKEISAAKICTAVAILVFAVNLTLGTLVHSVESREYDTAEKIKVAAIQGNYSSTDTVKHSPTDILNTYISLSEKAADDGAKFILWPESALNFVVYTNNYIGEKIAALAKRRDVYVMVGTLTRESDYRIYNCMFLATPDGEFSETVYYKRHLVPFGEYVPMRDTVLKLFPFLEDVKLLGEDMTPGEDTSIYEVDGIGNVGALICFDSIYETLARDAVLDGAEFFALGTNDSWFSDSAALHMHNNQARLRAIEFGRSILRAANTGTSTIITPAGDVIDYTEPFVEDYLVGEISLSTDRTLYSIIGNTFVYLCGATCIAVLAVSVISRMRKEKKDA